MAESLGDLRAVMRQELFRHSLGSLYDYLELMEVFAAGDAAYYGGTEPPVLEPAALSAAAINSAISTDGEFVGIMRFKVIDDDTGNVLVAYNNDENHIVNVSKVSTAGVATRVGTSKRPVSNGWGECAFRLTGTWVVGDEVTFNLPLIYYGRYTIEAKDYTATLVA